MADRPAFDAAVLDRWRTEREVVVETSPADGGGPHRAIIWIVVDEEGRVLIRSWRGASGRWYREAIATWRGAIALGDERVPVQFEIATDAVRIASCSAALERKYAGDPSTPGMVREEVLDTTLEVLPEAR